MLIILQDPELRVNRFVDVEAVETDAEEYEDEIDVDLGACVSKLFVLSLTHLYRLVDRR